MYVQVHCSLFNTNLWLVAQSRSINNNLFIITFSSENQVIHSTNATSTPPIELQITLITTIRLIFIWTQSQDKSSEISVYGKAKGISDSVTQQPSAAPPPPEYNIWIVIAEREEIASVNMLFRFGIFNVFLVTRLCARIDVNIWGMVCPASAPPACGCVLFFVSAYVGCPQRHLGYLSGWNNRANGDHI